MVGGKGCTLGARGRRETHAFAARTGTVSVTVSVGGEAVFIRLTTLTKTLLYTLLVNSGPCNGGYSVTINGNGLQEREYDNNG